MRVFLAGILCGTILMAVIGAVLIWWKSHPERSAEDQAFYDVCLARNGGNTIACDAVMRIADRERAAEKARKEAATLLAAGFSKREVVEHLTKQGLVGSQLSDAVGISLSDLQAGKY
jgi:hypothetical protein